MATCRTADKAEYAKLVRLNSSRIFAVCFAILGNAHDAEDVAQQTLLKGFTDIDELREPGQFGPWAAIIARNLCIDLIRRRKRSRDALNQPPNGQEPEYTKDYPELEAALRRLPEEHRLALMLYYFDGRSAKNIAQTLETSEAAVHTRLSRARKQLRRLLEPAGGT